jgi:DNA repair exonuclease SbcCD nuclease subunit
VVSADTLRFVADTMASIAPKPVFLAPGNHDPYGGASPYAPGDGVRPRELRWPDNVTVFAHAEFRSVAWPGLPGVQVTACGVAANLPSEDRRLRARIERPEALLSLLLFHGSRDDGGFLQKTKSTYPFSIDELRAQGFHWTALGHYHGHQVLHQPDGTPLGAYSGCLLAGGLDELGAKGALVVELGEGAPRVEHVVMDPRELRVVRCDLSGAGYAEQARARVEEALRAAGAREEDLIHLQLIGRRASGLELDFLEEIVPRYFHLKVDLSGLMPDLDLSQYPSMEEARSTEERFVARLRQQAESNDPRSAETARRALLYGLDALSRGRLDTRYEA